MIQPEPSSRHPLVLFLLMLCVLSGSGILISATPAPGSINALMPLWVVMCWAAMLVVGASLTLGGMALQPTRVRDGVLLEWVGMAALAPAALIYGTAILIQVGKSGLLSAGIIIGLGMACGYRFRTILKTINRSKALMAAATGEGLSGGERGAVTGLVHRPRHRRGASSGRTGVLRAPESQGRG